MPATIIPLNLNDLPILLTIERQNDFPWSEEMLRDCFNAQDAMYGIVLNKQIIAYAVLRLVEDEGELLSIVTDKNFRNQGYGTQLLTYLFEVARQRDIKVIHLEARVSNFTAIKIYQRLGFKRVGLRKEYYPARQGREDASTWVLHL